MAYATPEQVAAGFRPLDADEIVKVNALLDEAAIIIDAYNASASENAKCLVSCRIVRRAIGDGESAFPMGANQGSVSALGYSQSFTISGGTTGELYIGRLEKKLLGVGERIGTHSPIEEMAVPND